MSVLYRKYRPQSFSDVIGQEHVKKIITEEIKSGKIAHAFLFTGPRGVGKTTIARILTKALNCKNKKSNGFDPCNKCDNCVSINNNNDLDVIEIDAASQTGVDNVRDNIISVSMIAPAPNKYKVFIIDETHMLSPQSFNALLKTIEEPPQNIVFILATTEIHKVPLTIISRCQRFDFKKIGFSDIMNRLKSITTKEDIKIGDDILEKVAYYADGCLRDAESLLGQILSLGDREITKNHAEIVLPTVDMVSIFDIIKSFNKKNVADSVKTINSITNSGANLYRTTQMLIELFRKILLLKISTELNKFTREFDEKNTKTIMDLSNDFSEKDIFNIIDILNKRLDEIKTSKIPQLPLEMASIEICLGNNKETTTHNSISSKSYAETKENSQGVKNSNAVDEIKLSDVQFVWSKVVQGASKFNNSISSILKTSVLKDIKGNTLTLAVGFPIHQNKIKEVKIKSKIEKLISDSVGSVILINPILDNSTRGAGKNTTGDDVTLNSMNEVFGDSIDVK